ncbi:DUF1007 family protein [Allorhizobium undicola]|uniref:DUF1007 family protein n=1 Tax=Allorhizobium undicola TaxID=78527 RepID=UPI00048343C0|nr:DUF1007 family protein [Allorhizobium undicola]
MMILRKGLLAIGLFLSLPLACQAHPDIAITLKVLFNLKRGVLTGIGQSWTFDKAYSATLLARYDTDGDGALNEKEILALRNRLMSDLRRWRFFSRVEMNGQRVARLEPADMQITLAEGAVTVVFAFNLAGAVDMRGQTLTLDIHDPDYQAAFRLAADQALQLRGDDSTACRIFEKPDPDRPYFAGLITPSLIHLQCDR